MKIVGISANTVLGSAMVIAAPDAVTSGMRACVEIAAESNKPEAVAGRFKVETIAPRVSVQAANLDHWSAEKNARFKELSRNEALRELTIEEQAELESLTRVRRFEKYPRSADEILWQRRQQQLTRSLLQALHEYVEFHETPRSS
jgi:hypothetical protein